MSIADFYAQQAVEGRAVLSVYPSGALRSWITRVEGTYYACHAEAIHVRELDPDIELDAVPMLPQMPIRVNHGWRSHRHQITH